MTCIKYRNPNLLIMGNTESMLGSITGLCRALSLAVTAQVAMLIAKGWKITRAELNQWEFGTIYAITSIWSASVVIVQRSTTPVSLIVFLIWGLSWCSVVFM